VALHEPFHPESFRAGTGPVPAAGRGTPKRPPRHRQGERFLRGPVPWPWLLAAGACTGKALHVALALWHEAGMARSRTVPFRPARAREFGMSRDTARRGLRALERAGLVSARQVPGRCLEVTLNDSPPGSGAGAGE
jgi:hypothetical protein